MFPNRSKPSITCPPFLLYPLFFRNLALSTIRHGVQTGDKELYLATMVKMGMEQGGGDVAILHLTFIDDGGSQEL